MPLLSASPFATHLTLDEVVRDLEQLPSAPRVLPRLIRLPRTDGRQDYVFLGQLIGAHLEELFVGARIIGYWLFRVTRNSELYIDEEDTANMLKAVENELHNRRKGDAVRLVQCVSNLLHNAAKYTGPGGHIRLSGEVASGRWPVVSENPGQGREGGVGPDATASPSFLPLATGHWPLSRSASGTTGSASRRTSWSGSSSRSPRWETPGPAARAGWASG